MRSLQSSSTELLVVGAGPVGLFATLCAARRGLDVLLLDQNWQGFAKGYATILHPESVKLLREEGIDDELVHAGRLIHEVAVYVDKKEVARLALESPALAIGQSTLEETMLRALQGLGVRPHSPFQATTVEQKEHGVDVRVVRRELVRLGSPAAYSDWEPVESSVLRAKFVIGADGYDSRIRTALGIETVSVAGTESFAIFEFPTTSPLGDMELCFEAELMSAMIPLPNGRVRWSFQTDSSLDRTPDLERLKTLLAERAPWYRDGTGTLDWGTVMHFERRLARTFGEGRVWLAGDAAHVTNPFGGQSMNGGLVEARDLASRIAACSAAKCGVDDLEHYGRARRREWHKLLGVNVTFDLLPNAAPWLPPHARRILPTLPVSGRDLDRRLKELGLRVH